MRKHNKKRNVGIIYEQLLLTLSTAVVEKNYKNVEILKEIIHKHFKPGTQLYREFRLFNALVKTTVPSDSLATRIINEARGAARNLDVDTLEREKSLLIKDINYKLNKQNFYNQHIQEYKSYATIQTLMNDWRLGTDADIPRVAGFESQVHSMLLQESEKKEIKDMANSNISRITVKLMLESFNKKYGSYLNPEQVSIIKSYIFESGEEVQNYLNGIKGESLRELNAYKRNCQNSVLLEKIDVVIKNVSGLNEVEINDDNISKFLLLSKLKQEIIEEHNEQ